MRHELLHRRMLGLVGFVGFVGLMLVGLLCVGAWQASAQPATFYGACPPRPPVLAPIGPASPETIESEVINVRGQLDRIERKLDLLLAGQGIRYSRPKPERR